MKKYKSLDHTGRQERFRAWFEAKRRTNIVKQYLAAAKVGGIFEDKARKRLVKKMKRQGVISPTTYFRDFHPLNYI